MLQPLINGLFNPLKIIDVAVRVYTYFQVHFDPEANRQIQFNDSI